MSELTLSRLQEIISVIESERNYSDETIQDKLVCLMEECGELAKAYQENSNIDEELADILFLIGCIANRRKKSLGREFVLKFRTQKVSICRSCSNIKNCPRENDNVGYCIDFEGVKINVS